MSEANLHIQIVGLKAEIDRLTDNEHTLKRQIRELQNDIQVYERRIKELLGEIEAMDAEQNFTRMRKSAFAGAAPSLEEFLHPRIDTGRDYTGIAIDGDWEDVMYAYTDQLFIDADTPDLLLFHDSMDSVWRSPTNRTRLPVNCQKTDLLEHNILKVRPLTDEERETIVKQYRLCED